MLNGLMFACATLALPSHHEAYITNQGDNSVSVVDLIYQQVTHTIKVGQAPVGVAVGNSKVVVSNANSANLSVIDRQRKTVLATIALGGTPVGVTLSADEKTAFVANWFGNSVWRVELTPPFQIRSFAVGQAPAALLLSHDQQRLYVANRDSNSVSVINATTLQLESSIAVGKHPFGLALSTDGQWLASVNVEDDTISLIDLRHHTQRRIRVGAHPYCAVFAERDQKLYVSNTQDDTVSVLAVPSGVVLTRIAVGINPEGIAVSAQQHLVLVANWGSNNMSVINSQTDMLINTISTGDKSRAFGKFAF